MSELPAYMSSLPDMLELAALVAAAFLSGCIVGLIVHWVVAPARRPAYIPAVKPATMAPLGVPDAPKASAPMPAAPVPTPVAPLPAYDPSPTEQPRTPGLTPAQRLAASLDALERARAEAVQTPIAPVSPHSVVQPATQPEVPAVAVPAPAAAPAPAPAVPDNPTPRTEVMTEPVVEPKAVPEPPSIPTSPATPHKPMRARPYGAPEGLDGPRPQGKDNLKHIKGIGPRIEEGLNQMGVYHYDQIAHWDRKTVVWVETHFNFPGRIGREKWVVQARGLSSAQPMVSVNTTAV